MTELEPGHFLSLPEDRRDAYLASLAPGEQATLVLLAPWEKRYEIILHSGDARTLVQSLPVEELFWTIKATGPEDALPLVGMASPEQLQFCFDLDWWTRDDLRAEKILAWLTLLFETDHTALDSWLRWIIEKDFALIPSILHLFIQVRKRPDDMEIQEARDLLPPFTLEDVYYVSFRNPGFAPLLSGFLKEVASLSLGVYRDVMETMLWETRTETLETAYRFRCGRIEDLGIPNYFDSLEIYAPLPGGRVRRLPGIRLAEGAEDNAIMPAFIPTLYGGDLPVLRQALSSLFGTRDMERVVMEWAGVANKIIMADATDLDDAAAIRKALQKAASLLNLGLENEMKASGGDPGEILGQSPVEDLVRLVNNVIRGLSARARALVQHGLVPRDFSHQPDEWEELLKGLCLARPALRNPRSGFLEAPSSMAEVLHAGSVLDRIEDAARIMTHLEPHWSTWDTVIPWRRTNLQDPGQLLWPCAMLTSLVQWALTGRLAVAPLFSDLIPRTIELWVSGSGEHRISMEQVLARLEEGIRLLGEPAGVSRENVEAIIRDPLRALLEEMEGFSPGHPPDSRFVGSLLVFLDAAED